MRIKLDIQKFGVTSGECRATINDDGRNTSFYCRWSQTGQSTATNKTTISYTYGITCGWDYYDNALRIDYVNVDGQQVKGSQTYSYLNKGDHDLGSGTKEITHNADGTKTFNINLSGYVLGAGTTTNSVNFTLNTIPRHFTQTPKVEYQSATTTSASFKWTTSENASAVKYILDGGGETSCFSGNAKTGTFSISGLTANTSHTLKIKAQRKDSGLWSDGNTITFSTSNKTVRVRVNGVWKDATPYVRVNGQWKVAVPYTRVNGQWKKGK